MKVLFVCLGNICRSPMAEAVFRKLVKERGLEECIEIDSAGLGGWHVGERPHTGTREVLARHQIPHDSIRCRQIASGDLDSFDYIVAMDEQNMEGLTRLGAVAGDHVFRILDLVRECNDKDVPDPYYTGEFDKVYELVTIGCERLLQRVCAEI